MSHIVIIGAGPAGLTAATELQRAGHKNITILEATEDIGGISKTINYKGNRIDIGGHRFFSKSDWVMNWWRDQMPIALPPDQSSESGFRLAYQGAERLLGREAIHAKESDDGVMLVRNRLSRILFSGNFFDYPLKPSIETVMKLGPMKCVRFGASYAASMASPIKPEKSLEDFFINRFGRQLYRQFFKEYTEKVWGVPCHEISAAWGAQRVKSLSVMKMMAHAFQRAAGARKTSEQTSLIENFLYPKLGPGQMWERVAANFERKGGRLIKAATVVSINRQGDTVTGICARRPDGSTLQLNATEIISTMPIRELTQALNPTLDQPITDIGLNLQYRDFITVGVLYKNLMKSKASINKINNLVPDNWIYVQEPGVKVGRLQIFNNWSPYMVADPEKVWVGMEFFARDNDDLWLMSDDDLKSLGLREMAQIGMAREEDALDATVLRMPKAYPGYFGSAYAQFDTLRQALDGLKNLYMVGRNGMHRYNNQDHSMLSARYAAEAILAGGRGKERIWAVNIDDAYHEESAD